MLANMGTIDRAARLTIGLAPIAYICLLSTMLDVSTCPAKRAS